MEAWGKRVRATDRLFFAVTPQPMLSARAVAIGTELRDAYRLRGRVLRPEHLHVTLWHVGDGCGPPSAEFIEAVTRQAETVDALSFRVSLDHVMSFRNGAVVLCGTDGVVGLEMLHEELKRRLFGEEMRRASYKPHMTLLRDSRHIHLAAVEPPVEWDVSEFVLVHSLLGKTIHRHVARFPLKQGRFSPPPSGRGT